MILTPIIKMELEETNDFLKQLEVRVVLAQQVNEKNLNKNQIERFSRQLVLKNIGAKDKKNYSV